MDESVTYLCSAAKQGQFTNEQELYTGKPIEASAIQYYYSRTAQLEFRTIAGDLVQYDIHPPLYFWFLHVIHHLLGFDMRAGALLNLFFTILMIPIIYGLGKQMFGSRDVALAACVIWSLSPAVVHIDLEARHYQLLGFLSLFSTFLSLRILQNGMDKWRFTTFTAVNAAGFLTHYYYGFLLLPAFMAYLYQSGIRRSMWYVLSLLISLIIFLLMFPEFLDFPEIYMTKKSSALEQFRLVDRLKTLIYQSLEFFSYWGKVRYVMLIVVAIVPIWIWYRSRMREQGVNWNGPAVFLTVVLIGLIGLSVFFYLSGISPHQAVGEQYFSYIWPLLALSITYIAKKYIRPGLTHLVFFIYSIQLVLSCGITIQRSNYSEPVIPFQWYETIRDVDLLVTPIRDRAYLPRLMVDMPPELDILIIDARSDISSYIKDNERVAFLYKEDQWQILPRYALTLAESSKYNRLWLFVLHPGTLKEDHFSD